MARKPTPAQTSSLRRRLDRVAEVSIDDKIISAMIAAKQANNTLHTFRERYLSERERHYTRPTPATTRQAELLMIEGRQLASDARAANDYLLTVVIGPDRVNTENWFLKGIID